MLSSINMFRKHNRFFITSCLLISFLYFSASQLFARDILAPHALNTETIKKPPALNTETTKKRPIVTIETIQMNHIAFDVFPNVVAYLMDAYLNYYWQKDHIQIIEKYPCPLKFALEGNTALSKALKKYGFGPFTMITRPGVDFLKSVIVEYQIDHVGRTHILQTYLRNNRNIQVALVFGNGRGIEENIANLSNIEEEAFYGKIQGQLCFDFNKDLKEFISVFAPKRTGCIKCHSDSLYNKNFAPSAQEICKTLLKVKLIIPNFDKTYELIVFVKKM